ncbi:hypothetical protein, partial [Enterobacter intestinihominis]
CRPGKRSATGREGGQCGAVWCPPPGPLPPRDGGNTKNGNHVAVFVLTLRDFKTNKNEKQTHTHHHILFFIKKNHTKKNDV